MLGNHCSSMVACVRLTVQGDYVDWQTVGLQCCCKVLTVPVATLQLPLGDHGNEMSKLFPIFW